MYEVWVHFDCWTLIADFMSEDAAYKFISNYDPDGVLWIQIRLWDRLANNLEVQVLDWKQDGF